MATESRSDVRTANQQVDTRPQMRTERHEPRGGAQQFGRQGRDMAGARSGNETKHALKTTEFWIYLASIAGVMIAAQAVGTTANHGDYFRADKAWWFITLLTIGYLASRGLAKAGSNTRNRSSDDSR